MPERPYEPESERGPSVEFGVRVSPARDNNSGYDVDIWHYVPGTRKPADFAKVHAGDLWTALHMALPYMAAAAEPDPFARLICAPAPVHREEGKR